MLLRSPIAVSAMQPERASRVGFSVLRTRLEESISLFLSSLNELTFAPEPATDSMETFISLASKVLGLI